MRFLILFSLIILISACNIVTPPTYVYKADSPTLYLTVEPSDLGFKPSEKGWTKQFLLSFSQEDLLLVDADFSLLEKSVYNNEPPFDVEECRESIALQGSCAISVHYDGSNPASTEETTFIRLFFKYMHDKESDKLKEHVLTIYLIPENVAPKSKEADDDILPLLDMYDFSNKESRPIQISAK